ncbi:MAG: hypothetical protein D6781_13485, partial [Verrucomicrobia bacterium]
MRTVAACFPTPGRGVVGAVVLVAGVLGGAAGLRAQETLEIPARAGGEIVVRAGSLTDSVR